MDNFDFEVIASCKTQDDANWTETELVKQYDTFVSNGKGYNATLGGMNAPKSEIWIKMMKKWHASLSPEERAEISRKQSEAHRGERNPNYGKKHNDEWKQMMSKVHKGTHKSEETKGKMSQAAKIRMVELPHTIPVGMTGKKHSEETKKKLSEASKGKIPSNKIIFSQEQIEQILSDLRPSRKIAKDYNVDQGVILRLKKRGK